MMSSGTNVFGVPFARPPQRVPFGGLGGIAGPEQVGAVSEPGVAVAAEVKSGRHWTFDVIPIFRHYFRAGAVKRNRRDRKQTEYALGGKPKQRHEKQPTNPQCRFQGPGGISGDQRHPHGPTDRRGK